MPPGPSPVPRVALMVASLLFSTFSRMSTLKPNALPLSDIKLSPFAGKSMPATPFECKSIF